MWALVLLLQPTLSRPIYAGAKKKDEKESLVDDKLGADGVFLFRGIFDKNTHD